MKRTFYLFGILIAGAMITMYSCTKENQTTDRAPAPATMQQASTLVGGLIPTDLKVNALIKNFKQKVAYYRKNPTLKSSETVPADSALWYLEATINYSHAFPNEYYEGFEIDTAYLSIAKDDNGNVDMVVLSQKYNELKVEVSTLYHGSSYENKGLAVVDLKEASQNGSGIVFIAETLTGNKGTEPPDPVLGGPFTIGDNWWYGEEAGKCEENSPLGSDAAKQLLGHINDEIPDPNGNYFFINHVDYEIEGGDDLLDRGEIHDNHLDYYLFFATTALGPNSCGHDTLCVEWPEMNIYYSYLKILIFDFLPSNAQELFGKSIEEVINVQGYSVWNQPYIEYKHYLKAKFGEKVGYAPSSQCPQVID